ncbi:hypothetical protein ACG74X_15800 [Marivita sp. S0852]
MPSSRLKTATSVVYLAISCNGSARDLANEFVEEAKTNTGVIDVSLLNPQPKDVLDTQDRATETVRLELKGSAVAMLLAQIMRLVLPRRDINETGNTVVLSKENGQSVELDGSLPDGDYLGRVNEVLELIGD